MVYVWSLLIRLIHWTLVASFAVAFYTHESEWTRLIHVNAGYLAGALLLLRMAIGFVTMGYANFAAFPFDLKKGTRYAIDAITGHAKRYIGHNPAGSLVIYGMLGIGMLTIITGWMVYNSAEFDIPFDYLSIAHSMVAWAWMGLVGAHVLGVLFESYVHHENLIMTMITGYKREE